jgi:hypothetical protein
MVTIYMKRKIRHVNSQWEVTLNITFGAVSHIPKFGSGLVPITHENVLFQIFHPLILYMIVKCLELCVFVLHTILVEASGCGPSPIDQAFYALGFILFPTAWANTIYGASTSPLVT